MRQIEMDNILLDNQIYERASEEELLQEGVEVRKSCSFNAEYIVKSNDEVLYQVELKKLSYLRTIRNLLIFFTVLAAVAIVLSIICYYVLKDNANSLYDLNRFTY